MITPGVSHFCRMQIDTPEEGRALLDEALDWRGNYYFGCTGNGCVGCSSFQRCFRMLPRWALILGCIACVGALVPWAFKGSLATVNHGGVPMYLHALQYMRAETCAHMRLPVGVHYMMHAVVTPQLAWLAQQK